MKQLSDKDANRYGIHTVHHEMENGEKGFVFIALLVGNELKIEKLCENDNLSIPAGIAHNVRLSDNAILHTVKFGTEDDDWNGCAELDKLLSDINKGYLLTK